MVIMNFQQSFFLRHEETNKSTTSRSYSKCFVTDEHEETNQGCTSGTYSECFVNDENEEINQSNTYANVHNHIEIENKRNLF
ncbi:hypothetical protein TNCT_711271 [Trichonephila clavata]|uniref:Uncharacterized protein n=1 Tax=Trichonephila clavata TaxID=2740835 RepID=A0A8X6FXK6_TRICU|nr:hypothetical protein TNCT_711271 [Trichonephila clavata]